ncbi:HepT-like ribonuclease domain-containing protein [Spirosoma aerophilum]
MKGRFGNKQRLEHAIDAITEIEAYVMNHTYIQFQENSMMRFACIKQLEIIGEACNHVDASVKETFPKVEWRKVTGLRHILVHEYFGVDPVLIWDVITDDIPQLKSLLVHIVETL